MDAVLTVLVDEKIGPGEQAQRLLALTKERIGYEYALSLRSSAAALYIALSALDIQPGSKAAVSALCPLYYTFVLKALRITPLYCDIEQGSACISAGTIRAALKQSGETELSAIIVSETLGMMPDMAPFTEFGIPLVEDISSAFGSKLNGMPAGAFGTFTLLGLEERDMLTAGGGALLFAADKHNASLLKGFFPLPPEAGLADMNAAMALVQFRESQKNLARRKEISEAYIRAALQSRHKLFAMPDNFEYNNYTFPVILETGMKDVQNYAKRKEINVEQAFSETPAAKGLTGGLCPESGLLSMRTALFPLYPRLSGNDVERVVKLIQTLP
jgi:dTDP-4-amino-4,6-dideoxygalactose transaminase